MREISSHRVNGCNDALTIKVTDEPGAGGANHRYEITGWDSGTNPSADKHAEPMTTPVPSNLEGETLVILFQNGTIPEKGTNGITQEVLLAIVKDRLESFQSGPFACQENADALRHVDRAIGYLKQRTENRLRRQVEGTHKV